MTTPGPRRCAVLGSPIEHSLSPTLHRAAYAELGLDWSYDAIEVTEQELPGFVAGLGPAWRGLSLTMPLKRTVMPLLDTVDEWARLSGAANTVLLDDDGHRAGANTDVPGAVAAITERCSGPIHSAAVLGGGATAASVLLALGELGCTRARLLVRDPARAGETLEAARRHGRVAVTVGLLGEDPGPVDLLVSTIPAAAQDPELVGGCRGAAAIFEVLYDPWPTPLARAALGSGRPLVGGLDLLIHQAALQVELMTGCRAPLAAMRAAGEAALAARTPGTSQEQR